MEIEITNDKDGLENAENALEVTLEAATEIAEKIDDARKEGEAAAGAAADAGAVALVTLDTVNARFDGVESRLDALFELLYEVRDSVVAVEIEQQIVVDEILDENPAPSDTVEVVEENHAPEIKVEGDDNEVTLETVEVAVEPETRPSKKARWI